MTTHRRQQLVDKVVPVLRRLDKVDSTRVAAAVVDAILKPDRMIYPVTILQGRYGTTYTGANWVAFHDYPDNLHDVLADDGSCMVFFDGGVNRDDPSHEVAIPAYPGPIGRGDTPDEAHDDLLQQCPGECESGSHWDDAVEP